MQHEHGRNGIMRIAYPLYEGDGYLHYRGAAKASRGSDTGALDLRAIEHRARALRREVIAGLLRRLGNWIEAKFQDVRRRDVEAYLAQATDHADLERRLRDLERKAQPGYC
jgi:uncharacterized protein DUF3563